MSDRLDGSAVVESKIGVHVQISERSGEGEVAFGVTAEPCLRRVSSDGAQRERMELQIDVEADRRRHGHLTATGYLRALAGLGMHEIGGEDQAR